MNCCFDLLISFSLCHLSLASCQARSSGVQGWDLSPYRPGQALSNEQMRGWPFLYINPFGGERGDSFTGPGPQRLGDAGFT